MDSQPSRPIAADCQRKAGSVGLEFGTLQDGSGGISLDAPRCVSELVLLETWLSHGASSFRCRWFQGSLPFRRHSMRRRGAPKRTTALPSRRA